MRVFESGSLERLDIASCTCVGIGRSHRANRVQRSKLRLQDCKRFATKSLGDVWSKLLCQRRQTRLVVVQNEGDVVGIL